MRTFLEPWRAKWAVWAVTLAYLDGASKLVQVRRECETGEAAQAEGHARLAAVLLGLLDGEIPPETYRQIAKAEAWLGPPPDLRYSPLRDLSGDHPPA